MSPHYQDTQVTIYCGDCRETLRSVPDASVNCCVTSPPYFGLRDYGHADQIGLEQTPDAYVSELVAVFREVKRVLRDDGTLWLNLGDSYASYRDGKATPDTTRGDDTGTLVPAGSAKNRMASTFAGTPIKHKDLIGIPWRVAFALQADGWYLRQDIIWHKPNPMPESVTDRCTKAHEYIFLLSKSARYYFDHKRILEPYTGKIPVGVPTKAKERERLNLSRPPSSFGAPVNEKETNPFTGSRQHRAPAGAGNRDGRNKRSVWTVPTRSYSGAHFATFPQDLIRPCILAGCPEGGTVLDPFGGSGTTAEVARKLNRKSILCELNKDYIALQQERLAQGVLSL